MQSRLQYDIHIVVYYYAYSLGDFFFFESPKLPPSDPSSLRGTSVHREGMQRHHQDFEPFHTGTPAVSVRQQTLCAYVLLTNLRVAFTLNT